MCATCGCSEPDAVSPHSHGHSLIRIEEDLLAKNKRLAARNRRIFAEKRVTAINLMSSPGAGKTTLLERTIRALKDVPLQVIEGDQATDNDAARIRAAGSRAVQVNTGAGCHLDATMVLGAAQELEPEPGSLLMIENVGNLVCPALFDLGERARVVIFSVTEGEDKPLKYPHMFRACELVLLNKVDLLPYLEIRVERMIEHARRVNPKLEVIQISATRGDGVDTWCDWLRARRVEKAEV
jgi:hydrogenase nickel incorporation protein HypB